MSICRYACVDHNELYVYVHIFLGASNTSNSVGLFVQCSLPLHEKSFLLLMSQLAIQIHLSHEQVILLMGQETGRW